MHAEVLLVLILISFDTHMMVPIKETSQSPTMEEHRQHYESTNLTYRVILDSSDPPSWFNEEAVLHEIQAAFEYWGRESPLEFTYQPDGPVNITIEFTSRQAPCGNFGKQGGSLGCASYIPGELIMGNVYLDMAEDWTINDFRGTNIFQVTTHQIGRILRLGISRDDASVMQPMFPGNRKYFRTAPDDIRAIQKLYGSRKREEFIDEESTVYKMYVPCLSETAPKRLLESYSYARIQQVHDNGFSYDVCLH